MSHRNLEAEIVAELRRIIGEDEAAGSAFALQPRPGSGGAADAAAAALLERLRALPSAIGDVELRRRLRAGAADA